MTNSSVLAHCERLTQSTQRYRFSSADDILSYREVLRLWQHDADFRQLFIDILADCHFSAYRWETPPLRLASMEQDFEFVLLDAAWLNMPSDTDTFAPYFTHAKEGIAVFDNLGGDTRLVAPCPLNGGDCYAHLAEFIRTAPAEQSHALWRTVGQTVEQQLNDRPLWLNTAGGGVAWLHVRLDSRPKYYSYAPYKVMT